MPGSTTVFFIAFSRPSVRRRLPIGAELSIGDGRVHFRVWAPRVSRGSLSSSTGTHRPSRAGSGAAGTSAATVAARPGDRVPIPARRRREALSRSGVAISAGRSARSVGDRRPAAFRWTDAAWRGVSLEGQVVYELHIGTFTPRRHVGRGRERAAGARAHRHHADRGDAGRRVRGPVRLGLRRRRSVRAVASVRHARRFPPLRRRRARVRHRRHPRRRLQPPRPGRQLPARVLAGLLHRPVRERVGRRDQLRRPGRRAGARVLHQPTPATGSTSFISTACGSTRRSRSTISRRSTSWRRSAGARARRPRTAGASSSSPRTSRRTRGWCGRSTEGGYGLDALWNDDFHHSAMVALTGRAEAYYSDTRGEPQEFISAAKYGYLFQGQHYHWQRDAAGTPALDLPPAAFVTFLQNHDQVANSARGLRGHAADEPGALARDDGAAAAGAGHADAVSGPGVRGVGAVLSTSPTSSRELAAAVRRGRGEFLTQFPSIATARRGRARSPIPATDATFERCKLDFAERETHGDAYALHAICCAAPRGCRLPRAAAGAASTARCCRASAFALRFFTPDHDDDRVLIVNLGADLNRHVDRRAAARAAGRQPTGWSTGRARIPATAAAGRPTSGRTADGSFRARSRASCWRPGRVATYVRACSSSAATA